MREVQLVKQNMVFSYVLHGNQALHSMAAGHSKTGRPASHAIGNPALHAATFFHDLLGEE